MKRLLQKLPANRRTPKRLFAISAFCAWLAVGISVRASPVSEHWCGAHARAAHAGTLKVEKIGDHLRLIFDLSSLPRTTVVHRAWLYVDKTNGQPRDPIRINAADGDKPGGKPLELDPPWYRRFVATEAVRQALGGPQEKLVLLVVPFEGFQPENSALEVLYEGPAKNLPPQVEGLRAIHHDGQTFLVWTEHPAYCPKPEEVIWISRFAETGDKRADGPGPGAHGLPNHPAITLRTLRRLQGLGLRDTKSGFQGIRDLRRVAEVPPVTYRVYRHREKITPANILQAEFLAAVGPLAGYDEQVYQIHFQGEFIDQWEEPKSPIPTYSPRKGEPLRPGQSLYVHTPLRSGKAYYAVTMVLGGTENLVQFGDANSLASPVEEIQAPPQPVLQWIQDDRYNADPLEYWYRFWAAPPLVNLPSRSYRVGIAVSDSVKGPRPMDVHAINDTFNVREAIHVPRRELITFAVESPLPWMPELIYNEGRDTLRATTACKVDYFAERYMDYLIKWLMKQYEVDLSRTVGSMMYFGLRHPEIFPRLFFGSYTATYDYCWAPGKPYHLGPKGIKTVDGDDAWAMYSVGGYVLKHPDRDIPFMLCISGTGKDSGHTCEFGWQDDPRGWSALMKARAPFIASWSTHPPAELTAAFDRMRWDMTIPALSNCSLDNNPGNGDAADGDYFGHINGYLLWDDKDTADEAGRWAMTIFLIASCPQDRCTVDVTPRHCRQFKPRPGERFQWKLVSGERTVASGQIEADRWGLVTLEKLPVTKTKQRLILERTK
ncbi:MAG: hypothetical protein ABSG68_10855 [Thermoguttaceae bacterium]|jgi:hypothetical protein